MKQNDYPRSRQNNLVVQELENESLIYDLSINKAFCLNETSALVWQFCNGRNSIAEIADLMSKRLKILVGEEFVWLALDQFKRDGLLENEQFEINFNGLNRRQVIKKIGFASMIALPLVSSVIAPSAANAQSACVAPGGVCTPAGETQSNCCDSNQRCFVFSFGATCNPCSGSGDTLTECFSSGCCASRPSAKCCNSGSLSEVFLPPDASFACRCP